MASSQYLQWHNLNAVSLISEFNRTPAMGVLILIDRYFDQLANDPSSYLVVARNHLWLIYDWLPTVDTSRRMFEIKIAWLTPQIEHMSSHIAKTLRSTLIRYRSHFRVDWYLIDIDSRVSGNWDVKSLAPLSVTMGGPDYYQYYDRCWVEWYGSRDMWITARISTLCL